MKKLKVVAKLIELFGKVDTLKILSYGATLLSIISGLLSAHSQEKTMNKTIKDEVAKAIEEFKNQNRGVS